MLLLNFAYPLTPEHLAAIETLCGRAIARVIEQPTRNFDVQRPYAEQACELVAGLELETDEWQPPILVNLPSLAVIAVLVLAEIHGRLGHFPAVLRLRPVQGALVTQYEVAEILNIEAVRLAGRGQR